MGSVQTVMISSTVEDLREHREHARDACLMLDFFPKMMDYIGAVDASGLEASLGLVDAADLYVGIFARRYGTVPDGSDVSITEAEYQRAVARKIPRLILIASDDHAMTLPSDNDTRMDAFRARLLKEQVVAFFNSPEDLRAKLVVSLLKHRKPEPKGFSEPIRDELASANHTIAKLTNEQYKILDFLRGHRRVAIKGCAGSGKTLVAAEKAIRLDRDKKRVLMLCHNAHLAEYLRDLTQGTRIQVHDFSSWVYALAGDVGSGQSGWTPYEEPTEEVLSDALDHLVESADRYDAIIIDEGQDFRDEWWLLVDAALSDAETGILYVFHDDNQMLSPRSLKYPVTDAPYTLSANCRNGGRIFKLVREFHADAPQTAIDLERVGVIHPVIFRLGEEIRAVSDAVRSALGEVSEDQLVVLTTEPDPIENSMLHDLEIMLPQTWTWQEGVTNAMLAINGWVGAKKLPDLSDALHPSRDDIQNVVEWAQRLIKVPTVMSLGAPPPDRVRSIRWEVNYNRLELPSRASKRVLLAFLSEPTWADSLPEPEVVRLRPAWEALGAGDIALSTVRSYKGLESDAVILFVRNPKDGLAAELYVGVSRARYMLHLIIHPEATSSLPYMPQKRAERRSQE